MKKLFKLLDFLGFDIRERSDQVSVSLSKFLPLNWLILILGLYLLIAIPFGSWFVLDKTERGSVEYFGKFSHEVGPGGFYFKAPIISRVRKVATEVRYRYELGYRTVGEVEEDRPEEATMLTKGGHIASVYWIIQYTIQDTYNWLYQVNDPGQVLDHLAQGSMRLVIGKTKIDELLTTEKVAIQESNKNILQGYCNFIGLKVKIDEVKLQDCTLPDPKVQAAYDNVMNSIKQKEKAQNDAMGYANEVIPKAEGDASIIINNAKSYYSKQVKGAEGEVSRFMGIYKEYQKDPETTKEKLWYEAMQKVMPNAKKTIIDKNAVINLKNL